MTMATSAPAQDAGPRWPGQPAAAHIPAAQRPHSAKQRPADLRRNRQNSLQRAKNSTEQLRMRTRGGSNSTVRTDDGAQSRAGSRFAVGNVGSNGIIYLRPVARTGTPRTRPPPAPFVFPPITPPDSLAPDARVPRRPSNGWHDSAPSGSRTPTPARTPARSPTPAVKANGVTKSTSKARRPSHHARSHSFSTINDHARSQSIDSNTFKVVIDRPKTSRPRTADTSSFPVLDVPIPHYRLGNPRFSTQGTAILRSSAYTRTSATDDFRSSLFSNKLTPTLGTLFPAPGPMLNRNSQRYSDISSRTRFYDRPITYIEPSTQGSSTPLTPLIPTVPISPKIYDSFTKNADEPAVVRYAATGEIIAATPARLIAHITSPSFLDYELLSDFFLTFRSYLTIGDLIAYLIARLRWAVERSDDFGRIVRVRTFVALRHWILNYFTEDFIPFLNLREHFCKLVNDLYHDLQMREDGGGGDLKIIGELKKCWRRTCALFWDDLEAVGRDTPDEDIRPGGQADLEPLVQPARLSDVAPAPPAPVETHAPEPTTPPRKANRSAQPLHMHSISPPRRPSDRTKSSRHVPQSSITMSPGEIHDNSTIPLSPASELSMHVMSCSIPLKSLYRNENATEMPLYPHPVPVGSATTPSLPNSHHRRPVLHCHKRSGSFSDALRDHRAHSSMSRGRPESQDSDAKELAQQFPGSIIRGALFQPDSPYINLRSTGELRPMKSHFDLVLNISGAPPSSSKPNMANPGMKKILGSVRRALSSRQGGGSHGQNPSDTSNQTTQRDSMSTTAFTQTSHAGVQKRRQIRARQQTRVDLLAQRVAESFNKALEQELDKERQNRESGVSPLHQSPVRPASMSARSDVHPVSDGSREARPGVERGLSKVTMGSGSILIFDDTGAPPPLPLVMSGALTADESTTSAPSMAAAPETSRFDDALRQSGNKLGKDSLEATSRRGEPVVSLPPVTMHPDVIIQATAPTPTVNEISFYHDEVDSYETEPVPSLLASRPSLLRHSRSMYPASTLSGSHSLRKFASFQSGMTRHRPGYSIDSRSSDNDPFHLERAPAPAPARMLRRRPGGDLRGAANTNDLGPNDRPRSTGSVSNFAHSVTNSVAYPPLTAGWNDLWNNTPDGEGAGESERRPTSRKSLSLIGTDSTQPVLRASFEREVARLAALPDDDDDDGGIEAALLKLEGRYEKKSPDPSPQAAEFYIPKGAPGRSMKREDSHGGQEEAARAGGRNIGSTGTHREQTVSGAFVVSPSSEQHTSPTFMPDSSVPQSEYSYSSVPLLDRGNSDIVAVTRRKINEQSVDSARPAALSPQAWRAAQLDQEHPSAGSSIEHIEETESMRRIPRGSTFPRSPKSSKSPNSVKTHQSFLLDPEEEFDDISSDLSTSVPNDSRRESHGVRSFFDDQPADLEFGEELVPRPLRHPPTPPTSDNVLDRTIPNNMDSTVFHRGLPTPGLTPPLHGLHTVPLSQNGFHQVQDFQAKHNANKSDSQIDTSKIEPNDRPRKQSIPERERHIPFVLAYNSETLAEQLTIVEKDALDEIDWKELIELRWKQSSPQIRDWVEYLRTQEPRGVDVVIARFNIMVKWAVSECVLTEDLEERVRCIVKYIHIADHARRLRNYATMYQLTVALLSADCARLTKTWDLVPAAERTTLRELESLVQPVKNFHNLRLEMETINLDDGCIPFIGIYTRDLIYNAQKPATVAAGDNDNSEPLINFERHQTSATIVKNLLRLLEASTHYDLKPNSDIIPKCVWMAALTDEEISARSRLLE
ncbi:Guanine nucleotide exchange factor LTE1 [Diplodia seriata]|uniref:Guanine nucleotide exchange factor LTE1 n=1 Tax=Diplodia seriata TaxID=420778 RepID=A0A1S8BBY5_9PEZI|nr:Guanine nucleotide exchange factor LTE1 [Diplodia seriata]